MSAKNKAVFGIYISQLDAENAVHGLKLAGFRSTDISILFPDNTGTKDLALERNTKAPEGTAAGAGSGAVVGGILGWLAGVGLLAIPGLGLFVAAGPDHGDAERHRRGRCAGRRGRRTGWVGNAGVRSQALRGPHPQGWDSAVGALRRSRVGEDAPARFWIRPAPKTSPRPRKRRLISPPAIGRGRGPLRRRPSGLWGLEIRARDWRGRAHALQRSN